MSRLLARSCARSPVGLAGRYLLSRQSFGVARFASSAATANDKEKKKAFSSTLLLPKTTLPLRVKNAPATEAKYRDRTTHELYRDQFKSNSGPVFVLHDGPPYANGNLHMGHALNKILKDIINRYNVIRGRKVHYIPGWDCHGLPIEHKALAALGKKHTALEPVTIRQEARKFALQAIDTQKAEMKLLGVMADWDVPEGVYRTLDHSFEVRQLRLFQMMVQKGFITHRHRPTYYSPSSRTALAEGELEYADLKSTSVYVGFPVEEEDMAPRVKEALAKGRERNADANLHLAIWTTTPWSLPGNMGVSAGAAISYAVALDSSGKLLVVAEERLEALQTFLGELEIVDRLTGEQLAGTRYTHLFHPPSASSERPKVFLASYVTADSGTGLVHSAPAHGHDDYDAFQAMGMLGDELRCPIDDDGCFTEELVKWSGNQAASGLVGKPVLGQGAKEIITFVKENGSLLAVEKIEHRYPIDWRTKEPIIVRATPQWFADVESLKPSAEEAIGNINFVPSNGVNRLTATVLSRSEWCISRQRSWGVPIPALFNASGEPLLTEESLSHIISVLEQKGLDHWWSGPVEDFVPPASKGETFTKGADTLDVWFDSGTSWSLIADAQLRSPDLPLADVYLEGSDQHRGWFQSSILTRLAALKGSGSPPAAPYRNLITHGFTTDEAGVKMSKSQGNGISPMDVVNGTKTTPAYGSDTLRMWVAGTDYTRDASIGPSTISHAAEQLRKIRSALRFMLGNTVNASPLPLDQVELGLSERYILHELSSLEESAATAYDEFMFSKVLQSVSSFVSSTLSSLYFDVVKDVLYCDTISSPRRQAVVATLHHVLGSVLKMVAPLVPHLAEEVYEAGGGAAPSVFMEHWIPDSRWLDSAASAEMAVLLEARAEVLIMLEEARQAKHVRSPAEASVVLNSSGPHNNILQSHSSLLPSILGVSQVLFEAQPPAAAWNISSDRLTLQPADGSQCPRCWLYTAEADDALCSRCSRAIN